ncbi:MAG: hypothetical protein H7301_14420 [Cryobacterium sp.]|nr:hypothetical protein [Oligoflexia bacterium]
MELMAMGYDGEYMNPGTLSIRTALKRGLLPICSVGIALLFSGCGYSLQSTKQNSLKEAGVERVYVAPVKNESYKAGIENLFYNELIQIILAGKRVKLVDRPELADAVLDSTVGQAYYTPSATTSSDSIYPTTVTTIQITVATEYVATVSCSFHLRRQKGGVSKEEVWGSTYTRSRRFAGNNQKAEFGTTSALINESEFERTLKEVSHGMMQDVHEAMVARF